MTINTKKVTSGPYTGNDIADTFSYTFKINDKTQLSVYETDDVGVETLLTLNTHYTVNNIGNSGTVTRIAGALPTDYEWFIRSNYEETQLTAFGSQGPFFPDIHEDMADKLTMLIQQLINDKERSPSLSLSYRGPLPISLDDPVAGWAVRWSTDLSTLEVFDIDARYVNVDGDTMTAPLAGPDPAKPSDYIPLSYGDSIYVNIAGDTMLAPLAGPSSLNPNDYMPQFQVAEAIDARMSSAPEFDPNNFQDYGLVTQAVSDSNDYGSI